jgi:tetratricopeptide (TPR) repeat protein
MVAQFFRWLGPGRARLFMIILVASGLTSLTLSLAAADQEWSIPAQTALALAFLAAAAVIIGTRLPRPAQIRLLLTIGPALGLAALGLVLPRNLFSAAVGAAFGWLLAAQFLFRNRVRMEYRTAIKALRKRDYTEAIQVMTDLIKTDQQNPEHYRFRAELNRLAGRMGPATRDYEQVVKLSPDTAVGYNGLAEVYLQQGDYQKAKVYGEDAYRREPGYWVAPYNLGMIEDRLGESQAALEHLDAVIEKGLPDSRHRLLTYLWMARAHYRLGQVDRADEALQRLKREGKGLREWRTIFADAQAETLRKVLQEDVQLAERAVHEDSDAEALFGAHPL